MASDFRKALEFQIETVLNNYEFLLASTNDSVTQVTRIGILEKVEITFESANEIGLSLHLQQNELLPKTLLPNLLIRNDSVVHYVGWFVDPSVGPLVKLLCLQGPTHKHTAVSSYFWLITM